MSASVDVYFHHHVQRQTDIGRAALLLAECAEALGWHLAAFHADIHQPGLPRASDGEFIGTSMGWRARTVRAWVERGLARDCPVGRRCGTTTEPFLWECSCGDTAWYGQRLLPQQEAVLHHYSNDVCGGVTVPVHRDGKTGYVSWCSRDRERLERNYHATLSSIHLASYTFMRQLDRLIAADGTARSPLTPRELECLTWVARGRTTEEIAILLHRSADTIEFHVSNAMVKLEARNRAHAVAIACARGLIG